MLSYFFIAIAIATFILGIAYFYKLDQLAKIKPKKTKKLVAKKRRRK